MNHQIQIFGHAGTNSVVVTCKFNFSVISRLEMGISVVGGVGV